MDGRQHLAAGRSTARGLTTLALAAALLLGCSGDDGPAGPRDAGPRILSITPPVAVPGQAVILTGSGFGDDPSRVAITIGGLPAEPASVSETRIEVVVPEGIEPGEVEIQVAVTGFPGAAVSRLTVLPPGPSFESISAGAGFTCGIVRDRGAFCWGSGLANRLGVEPAPHSSTVPIPVDGGIAFRSLSAGRGHTCVLDGAGVAFCWGANGAGQLGDGTTTGRPVAVPVAGGLSFASITAGGFHTCGLTSDGEAWCWGENASGQLGVPDSGAFGLPRQVAGGLRFASLSAGGFHTCGLTFGGVAWCWGGNLHGELGDGSRSSRRAPVPVAGGLTFAALVAGRPPSSSIVSGGHTCGLTSGGETWCWGFNLHGQLGDGTQSESPLPVRVATDVRFSAISAGAFHTCGVTTDLEPLCWGANDSGQLGAGLANPSSSRPVPVIGRLRLASVSSGAAWKTAIQSVRSHTCGLTPEGAAFCWGRNDSGQLGGGTLSTQSVPLPVAAP